MNGRLTSWFCLAALALTVPPAAAAPAVRFRPVKDRHTVEVTGLDEKAVAALAKLPPGAEQWSRVLAVRVDPGKGKPAPPAMVGTYRLDKGVLRFEPQFPMTRGVRYRAVFDPAALPGLGGKAVEAALTVPRPAAAPTTVVAQLFPTADRLPENQLKFYLHFSAPMSQGASFRHITLLDDKGKAIPHPFLELDQEMWDEVGQRFTLFFDPGRIKRGLKPREEVGPALEEGKRYTLVIDRGWEDAQGNPLKETFKKTFTVAAPDDTPPDVKTWKLTAPAAGTRQPLRVTFPKPMEHALLHRLVWVADAKGAPVTGQVAVSQRETVWSFTPRAVWAAGAYSLKADTRLEDLSGNNLAGPFEVDLLRPVQRKIAVETLSVPFRVKK